MNNTKIITLSTILILVSTVITACGLRPTTPESAITIEQTQSSKPEQQTTATNAPTATIFTKTPTPVVSPTPTPDIRLNPEDWQTWPVIPVVSEKMKSIYRQGLEMGNDPTKFSKVGDCQNITTYFLAIFDHPDRHRLGPDYEYLQEAIDQFNGCFARESIATAGGMNVASVLSPFWAGDDQCEERESPLACELRLNQPSLVLISMEESWGSDNKVENYEKYMRQIIETVLESGAVPILASKADNKEGKHQINQAIARLAHEYDLPLWNFWLAVQPLPQKGLLEDGFHLTHGLNYFDNPKNLKQAWPVRNLTALQVIDSVWRQLNDLPSAAP